MQTKIATWLRSKGCYVLVIQPQAGIPDACPDILALFDGGGWATLEVKKSDPYKRDGQAKAGAFQPLQQLTVEKLNRMYYSRVVWPENWERIRQELTNLI